MKNPAVFIICGVFILLAILINKKSAGYLLAGYNTLSEEERKNFNIKGFLKVFRMTFLIAGTGTILLWYLLSQAGLAEYANTITVLVPLITALFIIIQGQRFYSAKKSKIYGKRMILSIGVLGAVAAVVALIFYIGLRGNQLTLDDGSIKIAGMYGEKISIASVTDVEIINHLPPLTARTNGFAFNKHLKGYFKTKDGSRVKLFVNAGLNKYLKISTVNQNYFWNSGSQDMEKVYDEIKSKLK